MKPGQTILATTMSLSMVLLSACADEGTTTTAGSDSNDGVRIWAPEPEQKESLQVPVTPSHTPHLEQITECQNTLDARLIEASADAGRVEASLWLAFDCHQDSNDEAAFTLAPHAVAELHSLWDRYRSTSDALCEKVLDDGRGSLGQLAADARCALNSERLLSDLIDAYGALPLQQSIIMPSKAGESCGESYNAALEEYGTWTDAATDLVSCQAKVIDTRLVETARSNLFALDAVCVELAMDGSLSRLEGCRDAAAVAVARFVAAQL